MWSKTKARSACVIAPYRHWSRQPCIPRGRQYWTLAGSYDRVGPDSEIGQLVSCGVITEGQYHGCERDPRAFSATRCALRTAYPAASLYRADLALAMTSAYARGTLRPEIVHVDTTSEPKGVADLLERVLDVCNHVSGPTFLAVNAIARNPQRRKVYDGDEFMSVLGTRSVRLLLGAGAWRQPTIGDGANAVSYPGNDGKSDFTMLTVFFARGARGKVLRRGDEENGDP